MMKYICLNVLHLRDCFLVIPRIQMKIDLEIEKQVATNIGRFFNKKKTIYKLINLLNII